VRPGNPVVTQKQAGIRKSETHGSLGGPDRRLLARSLKSARSQKDVGAGVIEQGVVKPSTLQMKREALRKLNRSANEGGILGQACIWDSSGTAFAAKANGGK